MSRPRVLVAILAAGGSRRLGRAKQLVPIDGEVLLRRQCRCALGAAIGEVVVILGCNAAQHREAISDMPVEVRVNRGWAEGLAATLRCAVRTAIARRAALLVMPCDQYRIVPADLRALYNTWRLAPARACVSRADGYAGPPAILPVQYQQHMLRLRGDVGARSLLYRSGSAPPTELTNPRARFDLDRPEDVRLAEAWSKGRRLLCYFLVSAAARKRSSDSTSAGSATVSAISWRNRSR